MIVNRYRYIEQLSRSKNNGLIKIITGLRRSGKSFLLKKLFHQHLLDEGVREDHILVIDMQRVQEPGLPVGLGGKDDD